MFQSSCIVSQEGKGNIYLEENIVVNIWDFGLGNGFLAMTSKAQAMFFHPS